MITSGLLNFFTSKITNQFFDSYKTDMVKLSASRDIQKSIHKVQVMITVVEVGRFNISLKKGSKSRLQLPNRVPNVFSILGSLNKFN